MDSSGWRGGPPEAHPDGHPQNRVRIHRWDWKGQPNIQAISDDLRTLFDGSTCPRIVPVPNSHCDEYVVFVTGRPLSADDAQALWDDWDWEYEESVGRA